MGIVWVSGWLYASPVQAIQVKKILFILFLSSICSAAGPKYVFQDPKLNDELSNVYHDIGNTLKSNVRISSSTMNGQIDMNSHKIINLSNGTATADAVAYGQLIYPVSPSQTHGTTISTTSSSAFQPTACQASITPPTSSFRVKVSAYATLKIAGTGTTLRLGLFRGASQVDSAGLADMTTPANATMTAPWSMSYIDSPASGSLLTYTIKILSSDNTTRVDFGTSNSDWNIILEPVL